MPIVAFGVLAAAGVWWLGGPPVAALWVALVAAAWAEPAPVFTGPKGPGGVPTPGSPKEERLERRYRIWHAARVPLWWPGPLRQRARTVAESGTWSKYSSDWATSLGVDATWLMGLGAAGIASTLPLGPWAEGWGRWADAVAAFACTAVILSVWRRERAKDDPMPDATLKDVLARIKEKHATLLAPLAGLVVGAAGGAGVAVAADQFGAPLPARWAGFAGTILLAVGASAALLCGRRVREQWRTMVIRRAYWDGVWSKIKKVDPPPVLLETRQVGAATVDLFAVATGPAFFEGQAGEALINPYVGEAGTGVAVLAAPDIDPNTRQPVPGTAHPSRIRIVTCPGGQIADLADPATGLDAAAVAIEAAAVKGLGKWGFYAPILAECAQVAKPDASGAVWATRWTGAHPRTQMDIFRRVDLKAAFEENLAQPTVFDIPARVIYIGTDGTDPGVLDVEAAAPFADGADPARRLALMAKDFQWAERWRQTLPLGTGAPVPQWGLEKTHQMPGGTTVAELSFSVFQGVELGKTLPLSATLATTMGAPPVCKIIHFVPPNQTDGQRNDSGLTVVTATAPIASPTVLPPCGRPSLLLLRVMLADAFDHLRLPRPEIATAQAWTRPRADRHVWETLLVMHGGITLVDLRKVSGKLASALHVDWLRLEPGGPGRVRLYAGADPATLALLPDIPQSRIDGLNWDNAWVKSDITNPDGLPPDRRACAPLPGNEMITVMDFALPPGLGMKRINDRWDRMEASVKAAYTDLRPGEPEAGWLRVYTATSDPMPATACYDWDHIAAHDGELPFGVDMAGDIVSFTPSVGPHLLVTGGTGSGKSQFTMALVTAAIVHGWHTWIADPTKQAIDFRYATPWASAIVPTDPETTDLSVSLAETAAMLDGVYTECGRRKTLRARHGVGHIRRLPDPIRPRFGLVVVDEFTSLITPEVLPPASDDPEADTAREQAKARNALRAKIGDKIARIAREARSDGIVLVLATQELKAETAKLLPPDLKGQLARVLLGNATWGNKMSTLRNGEDAPRLGNFPPGRGLWEPITATSAIPIQSWYAPGEGDELAHHLAQLAPDTPQPLDLAPYLPKSHHASRDTIQDIVDLGEIDLAFDLDDLNEPDDTEPEDAAPTTQSPRDHDDLPDAAPDLEPVAWIDGHALAIDPDSDGGAYGHPVIEAIARALGGQAATDVVVAPGALDGADPLTGVDWREVAADIAHAAGAALTTRP